MPEEVRSKEIAFYYPGPMWHHDDWIKTMILFFDGIGILLPDYLRGKPETQDPAVAIPLLDQGLLHVLEPEQIVDKAATEKLSVAMTERREAAADPAFLNGDRYWVEFFSSEWQIIPSQGRPVNRVAMQRSIIRRMLPRSRSV